MKIYKTLFLGLGLIALSSCSDFLNQTSPSELDNESTFNNAYYTELALNKVYGSLTQDQTYSNFLPIIAGTNTDCELIDGLGTDASNTSSERGNMNYNANPGWSQLSKVWDAMYGVIENANLVVDGINNSQLIQQAGATRTSMMRFRAEAMTLRAMIYFDLIRLFGDIPFKTDSVYTDTKKADIKSEECISAVQSKQAIIDSFDTFMDIMYMMIAILIIAAAVLGIVVLYNLGIMSYTERYREMATLKVVGFRDKKIGKLLIGQNMWVTLVGAILGIPLGIALLDYLLVTMASEYELKLAIGPLTYITGLVLTFGVSLSVSWAVARKNRKIDMVEALKGAE